MTFDTHFLKSKVSFFFPDNSVLIYRPDSNLELEKDADEGPWMLSLSCHVCSSVTCKTLGGSMDFRVCLEPWFSLKSWVPNENFSILFTLNDVLLTSPWTVVTQELGVMRIMKDYFFHRTDPKPVTHSSGFFLLFCLFLRIDRNTATVIDVCSCEF